MSTVIYLDNNATTKVDPDVLEAMLPYLTEFYGNPSSMHSFGGQVGRALKQARGQVANLLGAEESEIIFTSCGTEGNNTAIRAALAAQPDRKHLITTEVEHACVLNLFKQLEKQGYTVTYLSVNRKGQLDLMELEAAMTGNTALVSTMYANNETGTIFPIEQVGALAKAYGATFHVDAVQVAGKLPLNLKTSTIDLMTISGHKLHAPKGVGALYVRRGFRFRPLLIGGHQERGRRAGTENVAGIIGLGKAAELAQLHLTDVAQEKKLRDRLEKGLLTIPETEINAIAKSFTQYHQHRLQVHRRRSNSVLSQSVRHLRFLRLCLHLWFPRTLPCVAGNGLTLHHPAWLHSVQPFPIYHRSRS